MSAGFQCKSVLMNVKTGRRCSKIDAAHMRSDNVPSLRIAKLSTVPSTQTSTASVRSSRTPAKPAMNRSGHRYVDALRKSSSLHFFFRFDA